jgi:myo-inositol-1-phosphate synthase
MAQTTYYCAEYGATIHDRRLAELLSQRGHRVTARTEGER